MWWGKYMLPLSFHLPLKIVKLRQIYGKFTPINPNICPMCLWIGRIALVFLQFTRICYNFRTPKIFFRPGSKAMCAHCTELSSFLG